MKLYLDNCCYGRPFDDQSQPKIRAETVAIENIIKLAQWYGHIIYSSLALDNEIDDIKINAPDKYPNVHGFYKRVSTDRAVMRKAVECHYAPLARLAGIKMKDSVHLSTAISANADYLITTDKGFIDGAAKMRLPLRVINPLNFPLGGEI